jgi:hypothetical protein
MLAPPVGSPPYSAISLDFDQAKPVTSPPHPLHFSCRRYRTGGDGVSKEKQPRPGARLLPGLGFVSGLIYLASASGAAGAAGAA